MLQIEIMDKLFAVRGDKKWAAQIDGKAEVFDDDGIAKKVVEVLNGDFERIALYLEDLTMSVHVNEDMYRVVAFDVFSGNLKVADCTKDQVIAILALAIGGDEIENAEKYYEIAETAIAGWPNECRPIP